MLDSATRASGFLIYAPEANIGFQWSRYPLSNCIQEGEEGGECMELIHQPVKPEFTRKKVRKATGYAKFNFSRKSIDALLRGV